jgi:succinate-semialdehyde dehydrogenase/glutarate-semialdehyde dehydrogenase
MTKLSLYQTGVQNFDHQNSLSSDPYQELFLYINGKRINDEFRRFGNVINPANKTVFAKLPYATTSDLMNAVGSAGKAFESWKLSSPLDRSAILRKVAQLSRERANRIGRDITLDMGKPLIEAVGEVVRCADHLDWHAEECRRIYGRVIPSRTPNVRQLVLREPVGVVAAFSPWNFPYNQAIRKISAAIASGCTIIIKGPEEAPSALCAIADMFHEAGLPPGVLNVVWGEPSEVSAFLIAHPIVKKVTFTGSVEVGKRLAAEAGAHMKRTTFELGGHGPVIVMNDSDAASIGRMMADLKFRNAGQVCVSPNRFYVQKGVYNVFMDAFMKKTHEQVIGPGLDPKTTMGPLANERRLTAVTKIYNDAIAKGAVVEGQVTGITNRDGYYFMPAVLTNVPTSSLLMTKEPFGPIVPIDTFTTLDEALTKANSLNYGLSAYAFTSDTKTAVRLQNEIKCGVININHVGHGLPETPFGGILDSGLGSEGGIETFDGYLNTKFITQLN